MMATKQCMEQVVEFVVVLVNGQENSLYVLNVSIVVEFVVVLVNVQENSLYVLNVSIVVEFVVVLVNIQVIFMCHR